MADNFTWGHEVVLASSESGDVHTPQVALASNSGVDVGDVDVASIAAGDNNIGNVDLVPQAAATGNTHAPSANTDAVVTLSAPGSGTHHVIASIEWSYNDDPTGGSLIITDGGSTVFTAYITSGGPGFFQWTPPKNFGDNAEVVVTLAAGGSGISGSVNVHAWTE